MIDKKASEIEKWREFLKEGAVKLDTTLTIHKENVSYNNIKDIFDTLNRGDKISKDELYKKLPYNMMLLSKHKTKVRKDLPDQIELKDFVKLCLCIKSPYDYTNLALFDMMGYPKDKYNAFILGNKHIYNGIEVVIPRNILKGALKLYYDTYAVRNHWFLTQYITNKTIQYDIEKRTEDMRIDLTFYISDPNKSNKFESIKYIKEYYENYHKTDIKRIIADNLEKSYHKLNGIPSTIYYFNNDFHHTGNENNANDISIMIKMIMNALMNFRSVNYKYLAILFEKDINNRFNELDKKLKIYKDDKNISYNFLEKFADIYTKKHTIIEEYDKNKSIKMMFDIKEQCFNSDVEHIITFDQIAKLFKINNDDNQKFKTYISTLGFDNSLYAWHQVSEIISEYTDSEKIKLVLDEQYRYIEKNYKIIDNMKKEFKRDSCSTEEDYNRYFSHIMKKKDKEIEDLKYKINSLNGEIKELTIEHNEMQKLIPKTKCNINHDDFRSDIEFEHSDYTETHSDQDEQDVEKYTPELLRSSDDELD